MRKTTYTLVQKLFGNIQNREQIRRKFFQKNYSEDLLMDVGKKVLTLDYTHPECFYFLGKRSGFPIRDSNIHTLTFMQTIISLEWVSPFSK